MEYCSAAGSLLDSRLDPFHLKSNHVKFQLNLLRKGVISQNRILGISPPWAALAGCTRARKTDFKFVMWEHKFLMSLGACCNNLLEFLKSSDYGKRN